MESNSTSKLISNIENKGILFNKGDKSLFKKYSYYQVINAYKDLFIYDEDNLDDIKKNIEKNIRVDFYKRIFKINSDVSNFDLYELICNKICKKYGLHGKCLNEKEEQIKSIMYHLHIYNKGTYYTDFVRMYKFEHELRMVLLKYTLIIEESIKNIFTSYLNDIGAKPDYLINMDNFNTNSLKSKSFETLKLMIDKHDNLKSKPVRRKRDQHLTVPYWILINELAMNQTYYAIVNLNETDSYRILLKCPNFFTKLNISCENRGKSQKQINKEKRLVNNFKTLLYYLGDFRNMLAHNQPIYCYNVYKYSINSTPKFMYELPNTKQGLQDTKEKQQVNIMGAFMNCLQVYFGRDAFNSNNCTKLDLSKIIYILYQILKNIDNNTNFYSELVSVFSKYNIILNSENIDVSNPVNIDLLKDKFEEILNYDFNVNDLIYRIENNIPFKKEMKKKNLELRRLVNEASRTLSKIQIKVSKSKYKPFPSCKRYGEFTGINRNFFKNIV